MQRKSFNGALHSELPYNPPEEERKAPLSLLKNREQSQVVGISSSLTEVGGDHFKITHSNLLFNYVQLLVQDCIQQDLDISINGDCTSSLSSQFQCLTTHCTVKRKCVSFVQMEFHVL